MDSDCRRQAEWPTVGNLNVPTTFRLTQVMPAALKRHDITAYGRLGLNVWVPVPKEEESVVTNLASEFTPKRRDF
jgi:hypothetical protein